MQSDRLLLSPFMTTMMLYLLFCLTSFVKADSERLSSYLAAHPVQTTSAAPAVLIEDSIEAELTKTALSQCPVDCSNTGPDAGAWSVYSNLDRLSMCNETMLVAV